MQKSNPDTTDDEDRRLAKILRDKINDLNAFLVDIVECDLTVTFDVSRIGTVAGERMMLANVSIKKGDVQL